MRMKPLFLALALVAAGATGLFADEFPKVALDLGEGRAAERAKWVEAYKKGGAALAPLYSDMLVFVAGRAAPKEGKDAALAYYADLKKKKVQFTKAEKLHGAFYVGPNGTPLGYEIERLATADGKAYLRFVQWQLEADVWVRTTECVAPQDAKDAADAVAEVVGRKRALEKVSALGDAQLFGEVAFQPEGARFWQYTLASGRTEAARLGFDKLNYGASIKLYDGFAVAVAPDLVFEVGGISETEGAVFVYFGVWSRGADGVMRLLLQGDEWSW